MSDQNTLFAVENGVATITLNRPQKLNALASDQFEPILAHLNQWADDKAIKFVVIQGAGEKAFCAGGDVKSVWENRQANNDADSYELFRREYRMNRALFHFKKPIISLLDGITMGGGAGISMFGAYRIATEKTLFAMPETALGFFPDVGATWFLGHCPGVVGLYLGLTGARIRAADMHFCGLASHVVSSEQVAVILDHLPKLAAQDNADIALAQYLAALHQNQPSPLVDNLDEIQHVFGQASVKDIFQVLEGMDNEWAKETLNMLRASSPTSLAVTFKQITEGRGLNFDEIMRREYNLACGFLRNADFYEGIRSILVDKDRNPKWSALNDDLVLDHFRQVERLEF